MVIGFITMSYAGCPEDYLQNTFPDITKYDRVSNWITIQGLTAVADSFPIIKVTCDSIPHFYLNGVNTEPSALIRVFKGRVRHFYLERCMESLQMFQQYYYAPRNIKTHDPSYLADADTLAEMLGITSFFSLYRNDMIDFNWSLMECRDSL
jgi:hypothetical protein